MFTYILLLCIISMSYTDDHHKLNIKGNSTPFAAWGRYGIFQRICWSHRHAAWSFPLLARPVALSLRWGWPYSLFNYSYIVWICTHYGGQDTLNIKETVHLLQQVHIDYSHFQSICWPQKYDTVCTGSIPLIFIFRFLML